MDALLDDRTVDRAVDEIAFVVRSDHRVAVLAALAEGPHDRSELRDATGASSPTIGRVLRGFEDRRWIERDEGTYSFTRLGEYVTAGLANLCGTMATERTLRDVWPWLPREMAGFDLDLFADAVVSYPGAGYPCEPLERVVELVGRTDSLRGFGATLVKANTLETACERIIAGMAFEYVYAPAVFETVRSWNPDLVDEAVACENSTTLLHDALPDGDRCGLVLTDDRVAICCHDGPTGMLRAVVDTDSPEARGWAESLYERTRSEARPLAADAGSPPEQPG